MNDNPTIPLRLLADEWGIPVDVLADQFGDKIITDTLRIRHINVVDAIALLEARDLEAARHRAADEVRNAEIARGYAAQQARLQAIAARAAAARASDPGMSPYAIMVAGDPDDRLDASSERLDEMLSAGSRGDVGVMHRITPSTEKG
jgi:hypothetical protein